MSRLPTIALAVVGIALAGPVALVAACGGSDDDTVVVLAASSLTDVFDRLAAEYEAATGIDVVASYGGSGSLVAQLEQGAPADVLATADAATMQRVADDVDGDPVVFAGNRLAIAVVPGNPTGVETLADLERPDLVVVIAAPEVPAGAYAARMLAAAGVEVAPASSEQSVRAVAAKVALGEADAGIVYRTDIVAADGALEEVPIPDSQNVVATYPIVVVDDTSPGRDFVEFVLGRGGRSALVGAGFEVP